MNQFLKIFNNATGTATILSPESRLSTPNFRSLLLEDFRVGDRIVAVPKTLTTSRKIRAAGTEIRATGTATILSPESRLSNVHFKSLRFKDFCIGDKSVAVPKTLTTVLENHDTGT